MPSTYITNNQVEDANRITTATKKDWKYLQINLRNVQNLHLKKNPVKTLLKAV